MNSSIKQAWIEALRSGTYNQGSGCLRENDRYCCLGVLTDLYIKENKLEWVPGKHGDYFFNGTAGTLPRAVSEWAKLGSDNPLVDDRSLAGWNDSGTSFEEIADLIEEGL